MRRLRALLTAWRWFGRTNALNARLSEELQFHLDQQTEKNLANGIPPDEAHRRARLVFGSVEGTREHTRDQFRFVAADDLARDLRSAGRTLRRAPVFTVTCVLTLGLGIGAATVAFAALDGILLKPLPYPDPDRLVNVAHRAPGLNIPGDVEMTAAQFFTYREQNRTLEQFGVWGHYTATVTEAEGLREIPAVMVSQGTLDALGAAPAIGRWFSREDDRPQAPDTVILTHAYWQHHFGGQSSILGRSLTIDGRPRTIIGIMPPGFRFVAERIDLILPYRFDRSKVEIRQFNYLGIARLKPGVTIEQANADLARLLPVVYDSWPLAPGLTRALIENARIAPAVHPLKQDVVGDVGRVLWIVMATVGVVLLITCANLASLVLARTEGREAELGIRSALGASNGRLAQGLVVDHLTLAVCGAVVGGALAAAGRHLLIALAPADLPRLDDVALDGRVLLFAILASAGCGIAFGVLPIVGRVRRGSLHAAANRRGSTEGRKTRRMRRTLVVVQVALALVLLIASGLMIRTFSAMRNVDPGFDASAHVQLVRVSIPTSEIPQTERVLQIEAAIQERLAMVPGVEAVSFGNAAPLQPTGADVIVVKERRLPEGTAPPARWVKYVAPGMFDAVSMRLLAGRDFTWADVQARRPVGVISEDLARELFGDIRTAIGKHIGLVGQPWREIIGVTSALHDEGMDRPSTATVYWPALFDGPVGVTVPRVVSFAIRSPRAGSVAFANEVREAIQSVRSGLPLADMETLATRYNRSMVRTSFTLAMLAIAAAAALLLATVGIYGTMAYVIGRQTREVGIRLALGEQRAQILRRFVRTGVALAAMGVACGVMVALGFARAMQSMVFGVNTVDAPTYAVVAILMLLTAAAASYFPARRATRVDPMVALRTE
jgi:predicted permease